jgi:hypothetical protein
MDNLQREKIIWFDGETYVVEKHLFRFEVRITNRKCCRRPKQIVKGR